MQKRPELMGAGYVIVEYAFSEEAVGECGASFKLKEDVTVCVHDMGAFLVPCGRGSKVGVGSCAPGSDFQLCASRLG